MIFIGMKLIIKKILRETFLYEKLTHVDNDVNLIYDKFFKKDIDRIEETGIITGDMFKYDETNTSILKDEDSIKANELNHCVIEINNDNRSGNNFYNPSLNIISFGVNKDAYSYVLDFKGDLKRAIDDLPNINQRKSLSKEFTEEKIKGSIHHELAHWIDDTFHNYHIKKMLKKAKENKGYNFKKTPVNAKKFEIQAQIHNIKQLHNKYNDIWDDLTFSNMVDMSPLLNNLYNSLPNNIKKEWIRNIKTRMYRENLLGKKMY